jgi:hypothetical protein
MPPAPDSKLPSELADTIIDYLHDDNYALTTCSTVCKAWLPRSRFHLLGHISLASWNSKGFFDLLDSPLSTIAPYVRYLEIEEGPGQYPNSTRPEWLNDALPRLTVFTSIESLEVVQAKFDFLDTETTSKLFSSFQMLRNLSFWRVSFQNFAQVVDAIGECPLLEHIAIDGVCNWGNWVASSERYSDINISLPISSAQKIPHHLRTLDLGLCDKSTFLQWLLRGGSFLVLSTVRLRSLCLAETKSIGAFLHTLELSLEHLEIDFTVSSRGDVESTYIHILEAIDFLRLRSTQRRSAAMLTSPGSPSFAPSTSPASSCTTNTGPRHTWDGLPSSSPRSLRST